jgi:hypothetical protein
MKKIRIHLFLTFVLSFNVFSFEERRLEELAGLTFAYPGPNCFGVAMYANNNTTTIRGVDLNEFTAFIQAKCVAVQNPIRGDIGTFHNGHDFIHAFIDLGDGLVLEKTGVDYLGKTPVHVRDFSHTRYIFEASVECRRWGAGSKECYNELQYFRCSQGWPHSYQNLKQWEIAIEKAFSQWLTLDSFEKPSKSMVAQLINEYESEILKNNLNDQEFLLGRSESFKKQLAFLKEEKN